MLYAQSKVAAYDYTKMLVWWPYTALGDLYHRPFIDPWQWGVEMVLTHTQVSSGDKVSEADTGSDALGTLMAPYHASPDR